MWRRLQSYWAMEILIPCFASYELIFLTTEVDYITEYAELLFNVNCRSGCVT